MAGKFPLWASVFTVAGVIVLCALGNWQLTRLAWKTDLLDRLDVAYAGDANANPLNESDWSQDLSFTRGYLEGVYQNDREILIAPRTMDGNPGYHVLTPFMLAEGKGIVLVNRGWIPLDQNALAPQQERAVTGDAVITGMIRRVPADNFFVPENHPEKDEWYRVDLEQMAQARGIETLIPYVFYVEEEKPKAGVSKSYPVPVAARVRMNNNHLQYAVFWYLMAGLLVLMYVLRFMRKTRISDSDVD